MQFWALIVDSFRESRDRKIFWVMLGISVLVAAAMFCVSFGESKISLFFGAWEVNWTDLMVGVPATREVLIGFVVYGVMDHVLGGIGVMLALIATAGFFPSFMARGAVDVVLSKPMSRPMLFLGKYVGTLAFMLVQATVFVLLTFLVVGLRWKVWMPGYLWVIPLTVLLFSYLYCVSAWVAVRTRSALAAVLLSLGAWVMFVGVQSIADAFELFPEWQQKRTAYTAARVGRWIVPKTQDLTYFAGRWSGAISPPEMMPQSSAATESDRDLMQRASNVDDMRFEQRAFPSIASSLAFEAVIVLWAMWYFARKDF